MRRFVGALLAVTAVVAGAPATASSAPVPAAGSGGSWTLLDEVPAGRSPHVEVGTRPDRYQASSLDQGALERELEGIVLERVPGEDVRAGGVIGLPSPTGVVERFRVVETMAMEPDLAVRFPEIRTYRGQGVDHPEATVRFDVSPFGFHAQVLGVAGAWYVEPFYRHETTAYVSYFATDLSEPGREWFEEAVDEPGGTEVVPGATAARSGSALRIHRAAIAATGEYTAYHGGTVQAGLSAIVTALNRINGIYEQEVAIRFVLVADNDKLVYTDAATDPYRNNNPSLDIDANQANITTVIGTANFDVGHLLTTYGGGLATVRSAGRDNFKARATSGRVTPVNDAFWVNVLAHEMGHQYGATHTFNGCIGDSYSADSAYEPGSGSTMMSYAGICRSDNVQSSQDPYFHSASFDQILAHTTGGNYGDLGAVSNGNAVPTVAAGADGAIPARAAFLLRASGSDTEGDRLTYTWEQRDLGPQSPLGTETPGPRFRSVLPASSPTRFLPRLPQLSSGRSNVTAPCPTDAANPNFAPCWSERVPVDASTLKFRTTVRDNRSGGGGVNTDDVVVNVVDTGSTFAVTSQSTPTSYAALDPVPVTWNVAGTTGAPIGAATVDILLSVDGGLTFPTTLVTATPNDGSAMVVLQTNPTTQARVMVVQSGSGPGVRFLAVNGADITVTGTTFAAPLRVTTDPALPATITIDGIERDSWGINWADLPVGEHEVCFGPVLGWTAPPCQTVEAKILQTTEVVGRYTRNGYLRAITSPAVPSTISVDGVPRNDWGLWAEVPAGTYDVCFGNVAGQNTPACRSVTVTAGSTATTTGTFTPNAAAPGPTGTFGYLRATTSPAQPAMIRVDGLWRNNWGLDWLKLPVGWHEVCFGPAPDVTNPACTNALVTEGATATTIGTYAPKGFLRVVTNPSVGANITVNGQIANAYGMWTAKAPGLYDVCFGTVANKNTPPCQNGVPVTAGNTTTITGIYTPIP